MSWEVLGSHFVYVEEVAPQSILLDETMKKWIFQLTKEQREEIVDTVFSMLDDAKIYTVDDFYNSKWKKVQELMKVIDKYVKQNPAEKENKTLERFFDLLDVMDMEW